MSTILAPQIENLQKKSFKNDVEELSNFDVTENIFNSLQALKSLPETTELRLIKKAISQSLDQVAIRFDLATTKGFFQYYFDLLPEHKSQEETFEYVNKKYENYFGERKYRDYAEFRKSLVSK